MRNFHLQPRHTPQASAVTRASRVTRICVLVAHPVSLNPAYEQMVGTTVFPSPIEAQEIRKIVEQNSTDLARLDGEIAHARAVLEQLSERREATRKSLDLHRSLLSPIRKLPSELISDIFSLCLPEEDFIEPDVDSAPLLLIRVCRVWRAVALSTPKLWCSIHADSTRKNQCTAIWNWLSRSGDLPLSLSLHTRNATTATSVLKIFARYVHRWKHMALRLPNGCVGNLELRPSAPLLTTFKAEGRSITFDVTRQLWNLLTYSPQLHVLSCELNPFPQDLRPRWSQLNDLSLFSSVSPHDCLDILELCPNIVKCGFSSVILPSDPRPPRSPVILRRLGSLLVASSQNLRILFEHLQVPALHTVELESFTNITAVQHFPDWPESQFVAMVSQSPCSLSKLDLYCVDISPEELITSLQAIESSLVELTIQSRDPLQLCVNDIVLRLLTNRNDDEFRCLCPKLEVLKLYSCISCFEGVFADMVESRWKGHGRNGDSPLVARLRLVELMNFRIRLDTSRLRQLAKEGLELHFL